MKRILTALALTVALASSAWSDEHLTGEYAAQVRLLENLMKKNTVGSSKDFWLEKDTAWGWEKVALIFGYGDDYDGCFDIKQTLETKWAGAVYRCVKAN